MKRDSRIELRIPEGTKVRWQKTADEEGWPSLSKMILETIEGYVTGSALPQKSGAEIEKTPEVSVVQDRVGSPLRVPGSDTRECPQARNHRKGSFCKGCKKVITK
jgi:hypothetical protein